MLISQFTTFTKADALRTFTKQPLVSFAWPWVHQMSILFTLKIAVSSQSFYVVIVIQMPRFTVCFLLPQQWKLMSEYEGNEDTIYRFFHGSLVRDKWEGIEKWSKLVSFSFWALLLGFVSVLAFRMEGRFIQEQCSVAEMLTTGFFFGEMEINIPFL